MAGLTLVVTTLEALICIAETVLQRVLQLLRCGDTSRFIMLILKAYITKYFVKMSQ